MQEKPLEIAIIGGGVIGITTGIILNLHGYKTKIYTTHLLDEIHPFRAKDRPPELATIHAAASIIPHSVDHPGAKELLAISQTFFHRLAFSATCGVRVQRHYELYETPVEPPSYTHALKDLVMLSDDGKSWQDDQNIPHRKDAKGVWGWYFNTFFSEGPVYIEKLYALYRASGGMFIQKTIKNKRELIDLECDAIINCMGRWAMEFFPEDKSNTSIIRAHMLKLRIYEVPHDPRKQYFSYNYLPESTIYQKKGADGKTTSADVYFYPRSDGWLLGGSRQVGYPDIGEPWSETDEQTIGETYKKPEWDVEIPKPIWDLNRELIMDITDPKIDIADPKYSSFPYIGYRFARSPIRMEHDANVTKKLLIHNYGHGGAGYTLSWGSAYEVLRILEKQTGFEPRFRKRTNARGPLLQLLAIIEDLVEEMHN